MKPCSGGGKLRQELLPPGREEVGWGLMAAVLCIARLYSLGSERQIHQSWYRGTALDDLLGLSVEPLTLDRLYAGLDKLVGHKEAIEKHLKEGTGLLFDLKYELLLYDLTSTYFEGQCPHNPMAKRGYLRDHRGDCLQVVIALIVTEEGFPVGDEVFEGNNAVRRPLDLHADAGTLVCQRCVSESAEIVSKPCFF